MSKQLVCKPLSLKNSTFCHTCHDHISKDSKFAVNPCASNCTGICFEFSTFKEFPSPASIISHCPHIAMLHITSSKLSRITAEDLQGFDKLKQLYIQSCAIKHLPADLFKHTKNLETISFYGNKIKTIGDGLLTPLRSLKFFDLRHNTDIDYCFSISIKTHTLEGFKAKLKELMPNTQTSTAVEAKDKEIADLKTRCKKLEDQLKLKVSKDEYKKLIESTDKKIETLMMQMRQMQETVINFVVKVNDKEFKVSKQFLKTHSKALEILINANPKSDSLELKDVSVAVFEEVLKFMKTGNQPNENVDLVELFGAACRLEIKALIQITARLLQQKVNPETALKVLILCNKYKDHAQLKAKAFDEFNKNFPHFTIKAEFASNPEKLKQFWQAKQQMENILSKN